MQPTQDIVGLTAIYLRVARIPLKMIFTQPAPFRIRLIHVGFRVFVGILAVGNTLPSPAQDPAIALEESLIKVVKQAEPSVVSISRFKPMPDIFTEKSEFAHRPFGGWKNERQRNADDELPNDFGAGFLIGPSNSSERYLLTNYHLVRGGPIAPHYESDDGTELRIRLSDRRACLAAIIAADPRSDLAVLKLNWEKANIKPIDFPRLEWENATSPRKGQFVILLGNPYAIARDGSASVSWGLVSNLARQPITSDRGDHRSHDDVAIDSMFNRLGLLMQLDARLNLGGSGGPVLNLKGELIGISTSLAAIEGYEKSAGFAIPIDVLTRRIIRTLLAGQEVEYGMIGITPQEIGPEEFQELNTGLPQRTAALVRAVHPGSPAHRVGITAGDVIVNVEGQPVFCVNDLMRLIGLHAPESKIDLIVWKRGLPILERGLVTVRVKLVKWSARDVEGIIETRPRYPAWRGISVDYATGRSVHLPRSVDYNRVLITKVAVGSPGHTAGLQQGHFISRVNNAPVTTPAEFANATRILTGNVSLHLSDDNEESPLDREVVIHE